MAYRCGLSALRVSVRLVCFRLWVHTSVGEEADCSRGAESPTPAAAAHLPVRRQQRLWGRGRSDGRLQLRAPETTARTGQVTFWTLRCDVICSTSWTLVSCSGHTGEAEAFPWCCSRRASRGRQPAHWPLHKEEQRGRLQLHSRYTRVLHASFPQQRCPGQAPVWRQFKRRYC